MATAAVGALASLLALLAANSTSPLNCACYRLYNKMRRSDFDWFRDVRIGERWVHSYCCGPWTFTLDERCETLNRSSAVLAAVSRLVPWDWCEGPPPWPVEYDCGALAAIDALTLPDIQQLDYPVADAIVEYYSAHGLNDTTWTAETLVADHLRQQKLSRVLHPAQEMTRALDRLFSRLVVHTHIIVDSLAEYVENLELLAMYWRRTAQLLPSVTTVVSQLLIPLAFEHMGNHTNGQQLHGWIKDMEHVRDMLVPKFRGLAYDAQILSEQIPNYKAAEDKDKPGTYITRRPVLSDALLKYQEAFSYFREDFGSLCEHQLPHASQVFTLADAVYAHYQSYLVHDNVEQEPYWYYNVTVENEKWQLEDQSQTEVWVDTGCLQLLADRLDHPRCPLEELPLEASRRRQCREQLWRDLVERPPRPPVTSYLAYSERAAVSLCLLAWMAANSYGVCQDVPFSVLWSVHDALCYFDSPDNQTCLQSNTAEAICRVSRAILLFKCHDFSSFHNPELCRVKFIRTGKYSEIEKYQWISGWHKRYGKATERTLNYKESLNSATLKYKDFKVGTLKPLEYSFIGVNILFRLSTASVYMWLPHLGNLPGKILLSFQLTGLAQVLSSEVLYRMVGFPELSTAVLVDSCLTLLGCLWLNTFCFQMYACVRDLRLPNHLTPAEASIVFRRQLRWALIPWAIVSTACAALEKSSKHYLLQSRITLIVAISSSVALNLVLLGLVGYIYLRNKKSMRRLNIIGDDKGFTKKQIIFMSVNTTIFSGICVIIRIGFHQAKGIAQYVYYVHISTMLQGPVLFVFFLCNGTTLPVLKNRLLALWRPDVYSPGLELGSAAERNLVRRRGGPPPVAETAL